MENEKKEIMEKAAKMEKVPLISLDALIKARHANAIEGNLNRVMVINRLIKDLLGL